MTVGPPALFCTDNVLDHYGDRIARAAPDLDVVALRGDDLVADADLDRVEVAFFSADAWPDRSAHFMGAAVRAPALRWLHTFSAGTDHPVFTGLLERGVRVSSSSGAAAGPIARSVLLGLLALSRNLPRLLRAQAAHEWAPESFRDVDGWTVAVAGMGPIGLEVIRLTQAVGMHPIGLRRSVRGDEPCPTRRLDELVDVAATVDALVVALPLAAETNGIVSAEVIDRLPPHAVIVNVGRGELVDEEALTDALAEGRLGGAALDVFAVEPLPSESRLWDLPNVIITPHSSGNTPSTGDDAVEIFLDNLAAYTRDEPLRNER